jgi:hypothetical protein
MEFVEVIEQAVGSCDILIVLIGKQWCTLADARVQYFILFGVPLALLTRLSQ